MAQSFIWQGSNLLAKVSQVVSGKTRISSVVSIPVMDKTAITGDCIALCNAFFALTTLQPFGAEYDERDTIINA